MGTIFDMMPPCEEHYGKLTQTFEDWVGGMVTPKPEYKNRLVRANGLEPGERYRVEATTDDGNVAFLIIDKDDIDKDDIKESYASDWFDKCL